MIINNADLILHEFNMRSYHNILIGRDYMKLFDTIKFDFKKNSSSWKYLCEVYYFEKQRYRTNKWIYYRNASRNE